MRKLFECGLIFFQYKMNLAYHDAKYADLYGDDVQRAPRRRRAGRKAFCYTNPLVGTERAKWHSCPCCVGNIPRTLLMLPTWAYAKRPEALFVGGTIDVGDVAGTKVEMVQQADDPWNSAVAVTVDPANQPVSC